MLAEDKDSELFCMEANSASFLGEKQQKLVMKLVAVAIAACSVLMMRRTLFLTLTNFVWQSAILYCKSLSFSNFIRYFVSELK